MSLIKIPYYFLVLAISLLLVVLPQINLTDYAQSTITSKFLVFAFGCLVVLGSFIATFVFSKSKPILVSKLDIILVLLIGYITINRCLIQPDYGFSIRYMELLGLGVLYIILRTLPMKTFVWLLLVIIISGVIQAIYGNLQLLGYYSSNHSGFKLTGSFFNPGPYAGFLTTVWPLALGIYLFKEKVIEQVHAQISSSSTLVNTLIGYVFEYIPLLGIISIVLVIPATHSRGAWLAVLLSSLVLLEFRYHFIKNTLEKINKTKKVALIIFTFCVLFTGVFGIYHFKKGSADGRLFIWKVTSEIIKDSPITGVGFDRFKAHYMNYQADYFVKHGETTEALVADNTYYAFNEWLQFIVENGFVGFLFLLMLILVIFKLRIHKKLRFSYLIMCSVLMSTSIFAMVSYPLQIVPIKLILVVSLAILGTIDFIKHPIFSISSKYKKYILRAGKLALFALGIITISKSLSYTRTLEQSFKTWQNALTTYQYSDYEGAIEEYKKGYPILKKDGDFLMNYGKALSMNMQNKQAVQILEEAKQHLNTTIIETALGDVYKGTKQYKKAEVAYQHAANMIPIRFYPEYLLAKLYDESDQKDKAIAMAKTILKKEIKIPSTAIKEIKAEMKNILIKKE